MELSFKELKKRDVINVVDGRCFGRIVDLKLKFPEGLLTGIMVPGKKSCWILRFFDRPKIFIEESKIIKIGGDAILVSVGGEKPPEPDCKCFSPIPPFCGDGFHQNS